MSSIIRFICPDSIKSASERQKECIDNISKWIWSDAIKEMVSIFGGKMPNVSLKAQINWLNDFADIWDYRKKQSNGGERWTVQEDFNAQSKENIIRDCAEKLGLMSIETPLEIPNYILPLGGARMSNYVRPLKSKEIIDEKNISGKTIIALSGTRPINDVERPFLRDYAPEALTEFEAISKGMECVFSLNKSKFFEEYHKDNNINLEWAQRTYVEKYNENTIISLAAPSSDPNRRANSRDTFVFFLKKFNIQNGDRILLITSCIYVPFQVLRFMDLAIEKGFYVDCIGMKNDDNKGVAFCNISNYCQEIKATINAIKYLSDKWL